MSFAIPLEEIESKIHEIEDKKTKVLSSVQDVNGINLARSIIVTINKYINKHYSCWIKVYHQRN